MGAWLPKSVFCLKEYTPRLFMADLLAGIIVGLVALPLAMAFAIASGVPPQAGLYCAVVAGFIISAFGGSSRQIGGPTGAFVVVVFGIVTQYGMDGLYMCTLMAGVGLFVLGITGLGSAVKFIPRPVVVGFTNGIAVVIASTQIKDFLGLKIASVPGDFIGRMRALVQNISTISLGWKRDWHVWHCLRLSSAQNSLLSEYRATLWSCSRARLPFGCSTCRWKRSVHDSAESPPACPCCNSPVSLGPAATPGVAGDNSDDARSD